MRTALRWFGYLVGALLLLALLAAAYVWIASSQKLNARPTPRPERLAQPTAAQLADAPRQLRVMGCVSCHGEGLRGRKFFDEPGVATIHTPNLTLVAARATDEQLARGIRQGIGLDGRPLLIMPSEGYQFLTDSEVAALIAAIRAMPKGGREQPLPSVGPRGRVGLAIGKFHTAPDLAEQFRGSPLADFGAGFERGRHLVQVNCAECHGPNLTGMEIRPGTVSPDLLIAGAYDLDQFRTMLRTGVAPGGKQIGMMGEVARDDFTHLTDEEIAAVHAYLVERARRAP